MATKPKPPNAQFLARQRPRPLEPIGDPPERHERKTHVVHHHTYQWHKIISALTALILVLAVVFS